VELYKAFGEEIGKRFDRPLKSKSFNGDEQIIKFNKKTDIDHVVIQEDIAFGQRVREYILEDYIDGKWKHIYTGSSVGTKKIDRFKAVKASKLRLRITKSAAEPIIKNISVYYVGEEFDDSISKTEQTFTVGSWEAGTYGENWTEAEFDLTSYIDRIGQYEISFQIAGREFDKPAGLEFRNWMVEMYGENMPEVIERKGNSAIFVLTRSQQTEGMDEFPTIVKMEIRSKPGKSTGNIELREIRY